MGAPKKLFPDYLFRGSQKKGGAICPSLRRDARGQGENDWVNPHSPLNSMPPNAELDLELPRCEAYMPMEGLSKRALIAKSDVLRDFSNLS